MKVEVCSQGLDAIVRSDLKNALGSLRRDLKSRKSGGGAGIFHTDKDEDVAEIRRHIDAFHIVLKYYGG
jgi:hypothetical protein